MCCIVELARATIYGYELAVYHPQQWDACNIIKLKTSFRQIFICFKHDEISNRFVFCFLDSVCWILRNLDGICVIKLRKWYRDTDHIELQLHLRWSSDVKRLDIYVIVKFRFTLFSKLNNRCLVTPKNVLKTQIDIKIIALQNVIKL